MLLFQVNQDVNFAVIQSYLKIKNHLDLCPRPIFIGRLRKRGVSVSHKLVSFMWDSAVILHIRNH